MCLTVSAVLVMRTQIGHKGEQVWMMEPALCGTAGTESEPQRARTGPACSAATAGHRAALTNQSPRGSHACTNTTKFLGTNCFLNVYFK